MKKRFLACLLTVCMLVAMLPTMAFAGNITYVDLGDHWCEEPIYKWTEYGVVNGVGKDANGGDLFDPDGLLTREQAAAIFARLLKLEKTADVSFFKDVVAGQWYVDGIAKCYAAGIIKGTGIDTFGTGAYLTRADMFTMFCRALGIEEQDACDKVFDDVREVPVYAKEYTNALVNLGYVDGVTATTLQPLANITRAQMVALLDKAIVGYITEDGEYEINEDGIVLVVGEGLDVALSGKGAISAVVTGDDTEIDVTEMDNAEDVVIVVKGANNVKAKASAGTTIVTMDAEDATVNGEDLEEVDEIVVEEEKKPASSGSSSSDRDYCRHRDTAFEVLDDDYHREYCEDCGVWVDAKEVHVLGAEREQAPTCTEDGGYYVVCDVCDYEKWIVVPASKDYCVDEDKDNICDVCGDPICEHVWPDAGEVIKEPTCKEDGLIRRTCSKGCGATKDYVWEASKDHCVDENEDKLCDLCGKFYAGVLSGEGAVEVTVDDEYTATLKITDGALDPSVVDVAIAMNDVESLGGGVKSYENTIEIESLSGDPVLSNWLWGVYGDGADYDGFGEATVNATLVNTGASTTYNIANENPVASGDVVITATPESVADTRELWHDLINDETVETGKNTDPKGSYILIDNDSYAQMGGEKLVFEAGEGDLVLDDFDALTLMLGAIQDAATVVEADDESIEIFAGAGCTLAVDGTYAELLKDTKITVTSEDADLSALEGVLSYIRDTAQSGEPMTMATDMLHLVNVLIYSVNDATLDVEIEFIEPVGKFEAAIESGEGSVSVAVDSDYVATMTVVDGELKPSEVTVSVGMTNVGSLGGGNKYYENTIEIESLEGTDPVLSDWIDYEGFEGATIVATYGDYEVVYEMESGEDEDGNYIVTATPEGDVDGMWHAMVNDETFDIVTDGDEDSKIVIANDSYAQVVSEMLVIDGDDDLVLDNFDALTAMKAYIQDNVSLVEDLAGEKIVLFAAEGCMIDMGGTSAELNEDVTIIVTAEEGMDQMNYLLSAIRSAANEDNSMDMAAAMINIINAMIGLLNNNTIYVEIIIG